MLDGKLRPRRPLLHLGRFVAENRRTLAVDAAVLAGWAILLLSIVVLGRLPRAVFYVGLLAGVVSYSLLAGWYDPDSPG